MPNFIYGKVKRKHSIFRIIETEKEVYNTTSLTLNGVNYNPATLIGDDELYAITGFTTTDFSIDFITDDLDSVNYDQIAKPDLKKLSFICTVQGNFHFFQIINSSIYVSKKWFSIDELSLETDKPIVTINPFADAIYDKQTDTLYFKKLTAAQKIFKGMDQLYQEATDQETEDFLQKDFLEVREGFGKESVAIPNRKRIAQVKEAFDRFTEEEKLGIYEYTNQYGKVTYSNGKFQIETDDDLKFVLWGIQQRFYTTPIGGEKRIANSVISIL